MSLLDKSKMSQTQYFEELKNIIISVPQCSIKSYIEQKESFGKDRSLFYDEIEYLKIAETSINQLKDISLFLGSKVVEVRKQHTEEIEFLEAEIIQAKEEIQEQKQKLQEYYQIYQSMEEKNIQYQKQNFELEEQCDKYLQKLSALYQAMEAVEQQRIQSWNQTKKHNRFSVNNFSNYEDTQENGYYPPVSLQDIRADSQSPDIVLQCPSCTEKQFMIDQLQEEIKLINKEKYTLKERIFNLNGQLEMLKKRNGDLEKTTENINLLEKYSTIQKQKILLKKGKANHLEKQFYSTEKALSPCSSFNHYDENQNFYSSGQNNNYQNLLDEINQIKIRSTQINRSDLTFTDIQNSESKKFNPTIQDFANQSDYLGTFQTNLQSMTDYQWESGSQLPGVSQFSLNQFNFQNQHSPTSIQGNHVVSNFLENKLGDNDQQSSCTSELENKVILQQKCNPQQSDQNQKSAFCSIEFPTELHYLSNKDNKDETKQQTEQNQQKNANQKKEFYKNTKSLSIKNKSKNDFLSPTLNNQKHDLQFLNQIEMIKERSNSQNSENDSKSYTNEDSVQKNNQFKKILTSIESQPNKRIQQFTLDIQQPNNNNNQIIQNQQTDKDLKEQLPLTDDLKDIFNLKESSENFNIQFSQSSVKNRLRASKHVAQNQKVQTSFNKNINQESDEEEEEEEEKKQYIQSEQNTYNETMSQELRSVSDISQIQTENSQDNINSFQNLNSLNSVGNLINFQQLRIKQDIQKQTQANKSIENLISEEQNLSYTSNEKEQKDISNEKAELQIVLNNSADKESHIQSSNDNKDNSNNINKQQLLQQFQQNKRGLFVRLIQWIIFLILIPLSLIFGKSNFTLSKKNF